MKFNYEKPLITLTNVVLEDIILSSSLQKLDENFFWGNDQEIEDI